jgi:hypothetical protein
VNDIFIDQEEREEIWDKLREQARGPPRRKRFRLALTERLAEEGWVDAGTNAFRRHYSDTEGG